jgi:hypothetical protein
MKKNARRVGNTLRPLVRWLVCTVAFSTLVVIAWKGVATEPFAWTSWRPWTCWLLTCIAADIYAKRIRTPNNVLTVSGGREKTDGQ